MRLTNEQLRALPERKEYVEEIQPDGTTILHRVPPKFEVHKIESDDVIMFRDENGLWVVDYHLEGGPYKRRFSL